MGNNKSVLEMTYKEARVFFLKPNSYFNATLPEYINLRPMLVSAKKSLSSKTGGVKQLNDIIGNQMIDDKPRKIILKDFSDLNYTILVNKDGDYSWRPLQMIHPILYVDLVNTITESTNWEKITQRFKYFKEKSTVENQEKINCYSIPLESANKRASDTAETVLNWWENIEQGSLKESVHYHYCLHTDIADYYPSIYTHSIPWALHGKKESKEKNFDFSMIGNVIDKKVRDLQHGQTNGIPQGSVLMDLIGELLLGYIDSKLVEKLTNIGIIDYKILRYRDDYRIFSNVKDELELIAKVLTEVLYENGLKLNSKKTFFSEDIVTDSIKESKWYWEAVRSKIRHSIKVGDSMVINYSLTIQKHLWEIYSLSLKFPNSGMLKKALAEFNNERMNSLKNKLEDLEPIIGILSNIMINNPTCLEYCVIAIGKLLKKCENKDLANDIIESILKKFKLKSNTEFAEIWLQRLSIMHGDKHEFQSELAKKVNQRTNNGLESILFNSEWLDKNSKEIFKEDIIDEKKLNEMRSEIKTSEVDLFAPYGGKHD